MKTKLISAALGLLLALTGVVALPADPAEAHNYDAYSAWYCAAHRPSGYTLVHSWPYHLTPGEVGYWCRAGFYGYDVQYWVHVAPPGSSNSWRPWPYQSCKPQGITWCGTAGH